MEDIAKMQVQSGGGGLMGGGDMMPGIGGGMLGIGGGREFPGSRRGMPGIGGGSGFPGMGGGRRNPPLPGGLIKINPFSKYDILMPGRSQFPSVGGRHDLSSTTYEVRNTFPGAPRPGRGPSYSRYSGYEPFSGRRGYGGGEGRTWGREGAGRMARRLSHSTY